MGLITTKTVFDRRKKADSTHTGTLEIKVYYDYKTKFFNTGIKVYPNQWKSGRVCNHPQAIQLNDSLASLTSRILDTVNEIEKERIPFTFDRLEKRLGAKPEASFVEFMENGIADDENVTESTRYQANCVLKHLKKFGLIEVFSDVTLENIHLWDDYVKKQCKEVNSVANYHKVLKKWVRKAYFLGLIKLNPYDIFHFKKQYTTDRKYLTEEELRKIEEYQPKTYSLKNVKGMFLFCCYTGLAYSDLMKFDWSKAELVDGLYRIADVRQKTNEKYYVSIIDKAYVILKEHGFVFLRISNQKYNLYLKALGEHCGITQSLTTHMGRHTFATTIALKHGVPIETLSRMLGHSNIRTTQIYAKVLATSVNREFDRLNKIIA